MDWDEPRSQPASTIEIGGDLSSVSIDELSERAAALKREILRIKAAIAAKQDHKAAAASVFKT